MAPKSVCGQDLPLDATFDFTAWRKQPDDLDIPDDMDLQERNQHNDDAQKANRASIRTTRAYEAILQSGTIPPTTKDIGPKLTRYFKYKVEELEKMVSSEAYCTQVVAPIPPKLMDYILTEREKRVKESERKKEEDKAAKEKGSELKGSMVMSNVTQINPLTRASVSTPEFLLATIKYRLHPSFFWFIDARLRYATEHSAEMPMKKNTSVLAAAEKSLLDVNKLKTIWGSDDSTDGHSILNWSNASDNFLEALRMLCAAPDAANPFSYATEMAKHFVFIKALDDFEQYFAIWYPVEKKLRNKILDNNTVFDVNYWSSEIGGVLNAFKAVKAVSSGSFVMTATKISDLGTLPGSSHSFVSQPPPVLKQHRREEESRQWREPPPAPRNRDNGWAGRDSFRDQGRDTFRNNEPGERRPVHCLICTEDHTVKQHKSARKEFKDRSSYFSMYENGALKTVRFPPGGERQVICIGYNCNVLGRPCDGSRGPCDRRHICSLCGGDHPALPGDARCPRFRDGVFRA
ncbi:hypothetical protein B0H17DRAFT_1125947 [Mycena rosella]|uniref:Uncharacterized protein n=1 Tax=Mycena rosella TaxID=1033263 RepID=A0AAD7GVM6_MYCRO|nr:hypothetical protein B0H17DRAFT_1125947 [Mycena rosella]